MADGSKYAKGRYHIGTPQRINLSSIGASGTAKFYISSASFSDSLKGIVTGGFMLPYPESIQVSYPKTWESEGALNLDTSGLWNSVISAGKSVAGSFISGAESIGGRIAAEAKYKTGQAINSKIKLLFKDIDFRQFSFGFKIIPTRQSHTNDIQNLIRALKRGSAPSLTSADNPFFDYPDVYKAYLIGGGHQLFYTGYLACTNIQVDWAADGFFSQHKDGFPTSVGLQIDFTEMDLATRENLEGGMD